MCVSILIGERHSSSSSSNSRSDTSRSLMLGNSTACTPHLCLRPACLRLTHSSIQSTLKLPVLDNVGCKYVSPPLRLYFTTLVISRIFTADMFIFNCACSMEEVSVLIHFAYFCFSRTCTSEGHGSFCSIIAHSRQALDVRANINHAC